MNRAPRQDDPVVAIASNSIWNVLNFRLNVMRSLRQNGFRPLVLAPAGKEFAQLRSEGADFIPTPMHANGPSPVADARLVLRYARVLRSVNPVAFLGFTPKPNIFGSIGAALAGVPVINNVTGLGTAFIHASALERLVSLLYRVALRRSSAVFFHNQDDLDLFVSRRMVRPDRAAVIPGSGVDLDRFRPAPLAGRDARCFLFIGRLLREKGVGEFVEAARIVRAELPATRFQVLGGLAADKRAVSAAELGIWVDEGLVEYLGTTDDVRDSIAGCDCVVLPSYREGLPRVLLEAAAMARPGIAADVPGSRRAVRDGETGYLCEVRSACSLADSMLRFARLSPEARRAMGRQARAMVEEQFDEQRVSDAYLRALRALSTTAAAAAPIGSD